MDTQIIKVWRRVWVENRNIITN